MVQSQLEFERSYEAPKGISLPDFALYPFGVSVCEPESMMLDATYFDTVDYRLASARVALRRRSGGVDDGWHIKRQRALARLEQQWPLDVGGDAESLQIPVDVLRELSDVAAGEPLTPIARILNQRSMYRVLGADGKAVAELCDDHVTGTRLADSRVTSWREWEVELMPAVVSQGEAACEAALDRFESAILAAGALAAPIGSKLARVLDQ